MQRRGGGKLLSVAEQPAPRANHVRAVRRTQIHSGASIPAWLADLPCVRRVDGRPGHQSLCALRNGPIIQRLAQIRARFGKVVRASRGTGGSFIPRRTVPWPTYEATLRTWRVDCSTCRYSTNVLQVISVASWMPNTCLRSSAGSVHGAQLASELPAISVVTPWLIWLWTRESSRSAASECIPERIPNHFVAQTLKRPGHGAWNAIRNQCSR